MKDIHPEIISDNQKSWTIERQLCKGCGLCIEICPVKCLSWSKNPGFFDNQTTTCDIKKCIVCKQCELICPESAIRIS